MIHYTCDRCQRMIDTANDLRYVVKLEAHAAMEPLDPNDVEDDRDHLMEVHEILERADDHTSEFISDEIYQRKTFDLCADCFRQYSQNPLGKETPAQLGFSAN